MGFAPFGRVIIGMGVVDSLYGGYGDMPPRGRGPRQDLIRAEGNRYLKREFPRLDFIVQATLLPQPPGEGEVGPPAPTGRP